MIDFLTNLISPIVAGMGVPKAEVAKYLELCSTYIYWILGLLAALIIVLIAAHWIAKKGTRHVIRWTAVLAFLAALLIIINQVCYGPMKPLLSSMLNASSVEISEEVAGDSGAVIERVGEEGMVLVKNTGMLPLGEDTANLNVFGWASAYPVFSGTGSAASGDTEATTVGIIDSLQNAGYQTNEELTQMYIDYGNTYWGGTRPDINMDQQDWSLPELSPEFYTDAVIDNAKSFSDTAVIVIARSGGENADLPTDMGAVIDGSFNAQNPSSPLYENIYDDVRTNYSFTNAVFYNNTVGAGAYDEFQSGEHYLQLSQSEKYLVDMVTENFANVIVVINANNAMELGWVNDYDNIGAVILAPGTGANGMTALGEIINGTVNPSGKTVDTYLYNLKDAPTWNHSTNSGNHLYKASGTVNKAIMKTDDSYSYRGAISFVDYVEGIYTGYKFYETAAEEGLIDYDATVQYPFGYGLSYTTFTQEITDLQQTEDSVTVTVTVTNTGEVTGKDVVQLYYTPPYTNGGIEKASVNLIDFEKTGLLPAGGSQTVTFTVPLEDMASYDSSKIKTDNGGYVLEAGDYEMSVRSDSHNVLDSRTFTVAEDIIGRSSDQTAAENQFDYMESDHAILSRADHFANYEEAIAVPGEDEYKVSNKEIKTWTSEYEAPEDPDAVMPETGADNGMVLADMAGKSYDDPDWDKLLDQMTFKEMNELINTGNYMTASVKSIDKVQTSDCDGPSGLSNYLTKNNGTQFPTEVLMAQTWSKQIAEMVGDKMGQEFASANNYGWYGPAMNLHRSAFSGRNFEYYSEDAVFSGLFASCEVNAAAKHGVYAYIKHFAANDQETNRTAFLTTWMTEQTLRETCLKPFEMVVKNFDYDGQALAVMSSYNFLGYVPVISNYDLLTTVLRNEWGFQGMVISDYNGFYGYQYTEAAIRAGNDLMLGQGTFPANRLTDDKNASLVSAMRQACKNILYTVANSGYYIDHSTAEAAEEGEGEAEAETAAAAEVKTASAAGSGDKMDSMFKTVNWIGIIVLVALEAIVVIRWLLKKKKAKTGETETEETKTEEKESEETETDETKTDETETDETETNETETDEK